MNAEWTAAQTAALGRIVAAAKAHGIDITTADDLMTSPSGDGFHVSYVDPAHGLYAMVTRYGHFSGLLIYETSTVCSSYEGDDLCDSCALAELNDEVSV